MARLNLGAGDSKIDGFISIDLYDDEADIRADICELPFENDSVEEIVAYQVIEHVPYNRSHQMFEEMYRVLKTGGTASLETPDITKIAQRIIDSGEISDNTIYNLVGEYYRPWDKNRYADWEMCAAAIHRNPWNFNRIWKVAKEAGFTQIELLTEKKIDTDENLAVCLTK